jgi:hypothetical protein
MTSNTAYREQYDRMKRWHARFAIIYQGRLHDISSDNYLDDIYAFFQNCHHLKDWIKNDGTLPANVRNAVEEHINSNRPLRLCADICNSLKHLRLDRQERSGETPSFGKKIFALSLGPGLPTTISLRYEVDTSSGPQDAFDLATDCLAAWDAFLKQQGLL